MAIHVDQDVLWLDITEDDIALVHILKAKQDLRDVKLDLLL